MFLFERVVGFGIYIIILFIIYLCLLKSNISCKFILRIYLICLSVMAYFYKPYKTADLYRIYETMDFFSKMDFIYFWENHAITTSIPIARLIYWLVGKTGNNALLPALSALVCYSIIFYIIGKTKEKYSISNSNVACILFFIMTTSIYISVIGGIRMMLASCMIAFSYFRGTIEKKVGIIDILFYVLSIFIHEMSFAIIGLCIVVFIFDMNKKFRWRMIYILIAGVMAVVLLANFSDTMQRLHQKLLGYILGDMHSDPWEYLMGGLIIAVLFIVLYEFRSIKKEESCRTLNLYNSVMLGCLSIALCFCFEFSIFYRFGGHIAVLFSIPTMMVTLEKNNGKSSALIPGYNVETIVLLFSILIAVISCTRGSLSSLKFFEL